MFFTTTKEEREFKEELENKEAVKNVDFSKHRERGDVYISADIRKHGINLWELHDEYDFDIVSAWEDPTKQMLDICFRVE